MNKNNRRGVVLVISSPSGAGKTTICKKIINSTKDVSLSVSVTTRKKRIPNDYMNDQLKGLNKNHGNTK